MKQFIETNKPLVIILSIWVFINFICLMVSDKIGDHVFYPFQDSNMTVYRNGALESVAKITHAYDISEFAVYALTPIFVTFIYYFTTKPKPIIL